MSDTTQAIAQATAATTSPAASRSGRIRVFLCFFCIYIIWGSTYLAIRYAVETIPPLYLAGVRHLSAGTILLAWALAKGLRPTREQIRASVVIGFFFFLVGHGSLHWAEQFVPSGLAALLIAVEPIVVFLMSSAAARTWRINGMLLAGITLGLIGVGILVRGTTLESTHGLTLGSIVVLIGAISWSAGIIYSRRSHLSGSPLLLSALSLLSGAVMLLTVGTIAGEWKNLNVSQVTLKSWLSLEYLIIFGSLIAFSAYGYVLRNVSPALATSYAYVNPVVAVCLGVMLAGESITVLTIVAMVVILIGVALISLGPMWIASRNR